MYMNLPARGDVVNRGHPAARGLYAFWPTRPPYARAGNTSVDVCGNEHLIWMKSGSNPSLVPNYHGFSGKGRGPSKFSVFFSGNPTHLARSGFRYAQGSGSEVSMFAWVNQTNPNGQMIMGNIDNPGSGTLAHRLFIHGSTLHVELALNSISTDIDSGYNANSNGWHYLGCTYDNTRVRLYADGEVVFTVAKTGDLTPPSNAKFYIAHNDWWNDYFGNGYIADPIYFKAGLTPAEARALYREALFGYPGIMPPAKGPLDYTFIAQASPDVPHNPWDTQAVMSRAAIRRNTAHLTAGRVLGDVVRPDAQDPVVFTGVWHVSMALPVRPARSSDDRRWAYPFQAIGYPPIAEPVTADRFTTPAPAVLVRRRMPPLEGFATDWLHLADAESVSVSAFDVVMSRVLPRRRHPILDPGSALLVPALIPEDPFNAPSLMWHVSLALPPRALKAREPRPLYPWLALQLVPELTFEAPEIKFHTPLTLPRILRVRHLPPGLALGGVDLEPTQRPELTFPAAYTLTLALPPKLTRRYVERATGALGLDPALLVEAVHPEVLLRVDPRVVRRVFHVALTALDSAPELREAGFELPPNYHNAMLAAGHWRARL